MGSASSFRPSEPAKIRRVMADRVEPWVVQLFLRSVSGVLPDTYHFRVKGSSVTRERLNQLTTSCQFRFNFTWLSWRKPEILPCHACHATFSEFIGRWLAAVQPDPTVLDRTSCPAPSENRCSSKNSRTRCFFPLRTRAVPNFENTILQLQ